MRFQVGHGILAKIRFKDGVMPAKPRTYLVVEVGTDYIKVLNVSSSAGKEAKMQMKSNEVLVNYEPPFKVPSFVKLDSLVTVNNPTRDITILHGGDTLNEPELRNIQSKMNDFN